MLYHFSYALDPNNLFLTAHLRFLPIAAAMGLFYPDGRFTFFLVTAVRKILDGTFPLFQRLTSTNTT